MSFISYQCRVCNKSVTEISNFKLSGNIVRKLSCGHSQIDKTIKEIQDNKFELLESADHRKLFPFQVVGAKFAEKGNLNVLFADEMGLGKTIQILAVLKVHEAEALPVAVICKSSLKTQWSIEIGRWFGPETLRYQVENSKDVIPPCFKFYIFSFDILRRFVKKNKTRNLQGELIDEEDYSHLITLFESLHINTIIIDECQHIKNHQSSRSKAVRTVCQTTKYKLAASGAPIKNHGAEFFPILNILRPELVKVYEDFRKDWCENYWTGYSYKIGGIKDIKKFEEYTKDFIIRRTRDEVELDFPERNRQYHYFDLGSEVEAAYNQVEQELVEYSENNSDNSFKESTNLLGYLNKMRHLTGLSKVKDTIDFIDDFIMSTDRKIVVFVHHIDVGSLIQQKCNDLIKNINEMFGKRYSSPYRMLGGQAEKIFEIGEQFQKDNNARVLIAPTLAAGEGLNLQTIGDCIIVEREWNPPNEEQAEGRFIRIGSTHKTVCANYMLAIGTVDEKFTNIVERKRAIISGSLDGKTYNWSETDIIKELTNEIVKSRQKRMK